MDTKAIVDLKNQVIEKYGAWDSNNVYLEDGLYTMGSEIVGDEIKLQRVPSNAFSFTWGERWKACASSIWAVEKGFTRSNSPGGRHRVWRSKGASRGPKRCDSSRRSYLLDNLDVAQDDVRNLQRRKIREVRRCSVSGNLVSLGSAGRVLFCSET